MKIRARGEVAQQTEGTRAPKKSTTEKGKKKREKTPKTKQDDLEAGEKARSQKACIYGTPSKKKGRKVSPSETNTKKK